MHEALIAPGQPEERQMYCGTLPYSVYTARGTPPCRGWMEYRPVGGAGSQNGKRGFCRVKLLPTRCEADAL